MEEKVFSDECVGENQEADDLSGENTDEPPHHRQPSLFLPDNNVQVINTKLFHVGLAALHSLAQSPRECKGSDEERLAFPWGLCCMVGAPQASNAKKCEGTST
jgi:hypothetical protein